MHESLLNLIEYTPVGDIIVLALCIIMGILMRQTYISGSKTRYIIIMRIVIGAAVAALLNMGFRMLLYSEDAPPLPIYAMRLLSNVFLSITLYQYLRYLFGPLWIPQGMQQRYKTMSIAVMCAAVLIDILGTVFGFGFSLRPDGASPGFNVFIPLYVAYMGLILYMIIHYRSRLLRQVFRGLVSVNAVSIVMLGIQGTHGQVSYTTLCYFLPVISLIFLFHSNPFDVDTGAVSSGYFEDEIRESLGKGVKTLIMCCTMVNFSKAIAQSGEIKTEFYKFFRQNVRKGVLYHFPGERLVLTIPERRGVDYEASVQKMLDDFGVSYRKIGIDYKIVIMETSEAVLDVKDYFQLIEYSESRMPFNTVHRITEKDVQGYYDKNYILHELQDIAEKKDLSDPRVLVYCQPVFNLTTGRYDTAEALMRLKLEKTGMVYPDQFIPLAEQFGLIHNMSMIILNKTCFAIRDFVEEGYYIKRVSVNFSAIDIRYDSFCQEVKLIIDRNGIDYDKIAVEITESRSEADFNLMKQRVTQLQDLGIKFYLDDFGTGYSNFERIMEIPFDIIKFDRSLLIESTKNDSSLYMVKTFANMFHDLKYAILFEGVENESDEDRCIMMKAQYLQGYKYSRPIPIEELREFLSPA